LQLGLLELKAYHEGKLSEKFTLHSELGYNMWLFGMHFYDGAQFVLVPEFTLQPRFYYNLRKRSEKGKQVANNSGNFVAFETGYHAGQLIISSVESLYGRGTVSLGPMWGIRRKMGNRFEFETGAGLIYWLQFTKNAASTENISNLMINLHLRLGVRLN